MRDFFMLPFRPTNQPAWYGPVGYLAALLGVTMATGVLWVTASILSPGSIYLVYLVVVVAVAVGWGLKQGVVASVLSFLAANFFFIPPVFTFTIANTQDVLALVIFLGLATLTSQLVARLRQEAQEARRSQQIAVTLYELSQTINRQRNLQLLLNEVCRQLSTILNTDACTISLKTGEDSPPMVAYSGELMSEENKDAGIVRTSIGSDDMQLGGLYVRLASQRRVTAEERSMLAAFAEQLQVAAERARLQDVEIQTEVLRRTDELRVALLSAVAHDLRTPLGSIETAATSILNPALKLSSEDQRDFLGAIVGEVGRINRLVSNLLDMSRIEAGRLSPQKAPHRIEDVIANVLERLQLRFNSHTVDTNIEPALPVVPFDAVEIDAVITNLLENALKYTPPGTPIHVHARRTASAGRRAEMMEVIVSDEGRGVPAEYLAHLFNRFYRVTEGTAANVKGTGLGLYIAKGIVEAHKGQIRASNLPGGGLRVSFTLPMHPHENAKEQVLATSKLATRAS